MISSILLQRLFHNIWTRLYTTVMPGIPKGVTTCPQLHLGSAMSLGEPLPASRIQSWNVLLKRNQLMGNHTKTSISGSSDAIQPQPDTTETTKQPHRRTTKPFAQCKLQLQGTKAPTRGPQPSPPNAT